MALPSKPASSPSSLRAGVELPAAASLLCLISLGVLAWLAYEVGPFEQVDLSVLSRVSGYGESHGADFAEYLAHLADPGSLCVLTALICLSGLAGGRPRHALAAVAVVVGADLTTVVLKSALAHPRPHAALGSHQIVPAAFPSGHSTAATALALALVLVVAPPWRAVAVPAGLLMILAVGFSLVFLGDHFPSDVLGGWLVALAWWFAAIAALRLAARAGSPRQVEPSGRKLPPPCTRS